MCLLFTCTFHTQPEAEIDLRRNICLLLKLFSLSHPARPLRTLTGSNSPDPRGLPPALPMAQDPISSQPGAVSPCPSDAAGQCSAALPQPCPLPDALAQPQPSPLGCHPRAVSVPQLCLFFFPSAF